MDVFSLAAKITLDTNEYESALGDASGKTHSFGEKLKSGLATAAKAGAAGLAAATTAVTTLSKAALDSYGDYEQLVGGVETLFKTSADVVMEYANNAYQTAGLSANQYMETVTSFSASLLQGLGRDTEAAAKTADLAITDMADNANKLGTSMDMIQNAYQGFAKQNYTMLDNLKLGYGGTQAEMARLINDSGVLGGTMKVTAETVNQVSFDKMIEAIHVVQTEMGITGTTAAEAASTIQGSVSAAKSAWANLVAGLGNENADLDQLVSNLVTSVETAAGNILPRVTQILSGMGTAIEQLAPVIAAEVPNLITSVLPSLVSGGAQLLTGLITGLISALPGLVSAAPEIVSSISSALSQNLPTIRDSGKELLDMLVTGISISFPELIPAAVGSILQFVEGLTDPNNLSTLVDGAIAIILALADGLISSIPRILESVPVIVKNLIVALIENAPKLQVASLQLILSLGAGLVDYISELPAYISKVGDAIKDGFLEGVDKLKDVGGQLLEGLWNGISDKVEWLKGKVSGVVDTIKGWFTGPKGFDEHSPSKWANRVFRYVMEGGGNGLEEGLPGMMQNVDSVVGKVKNGLDFGTANVDFASSGLGMSSAGIINSISGGTENGGVISLTINLQTADGAKLASWLLPDLIKAGAANGTPISSGQYA